MIAFCVIGIACKYPKGIAHDIDGAQVAQVRRRRIKGSTLQQNYILVPHLPACVDGTLDIHPVGEASRENDRTASFCNMVDEPHVAEIERSDLEGACSELIEFVNRYNMEKRLKSLDYRTPAQYVKEEKNIILQRIVI